MFSLKKTFPECFPEIINITISEAELDVQIPP